MNIWLDDEGFIDIEPCAMAPYADEADLQRMDRQVAAMKWEKNLLAIYKERGYDYRHDA